MNPQLRRLLAGLRHRDADRTHEIFPPLRRAEMFSAIVAGEGAVPTSRTERTHRRRRSYRWQSPVCALPPMRWSAMAAALVACTLAGAVAVVAFNASSHRSGVTTRHTAPVVKTMPVSFRTTDYGYIIATVTDPFAAQSALDAAFREAGVNIAVHLVPASPSAVGTLVSTSEPASGAQIQALVGGTCVTGGGGPGACPIGVKIPVDFTGQGSITLGRPAEPGEAYAAANDAFAPGESLHCSGLLGQQVAAALPQLKADNITARWRFVPYNTPATPAVATPPPGNYYIVGGQPISAGVVWFQTQPDPLSSNPGEQTAAQQYNQGC